MLGPQLLELPAAFRRPLNGLCRIKQNEEDYLAAWYDNNVLLSPVNARESGCRILKIKDPVQCVFQNRTSLHCVDESGTIFSLIYVKNEDDVDVFDSSTDDEFNIVMEQSFIASIVINDMVCISPLRSGLVLLKYNLGKLYIELYDSITNDNELKKSSCIDLCTVHDVSAKHCTLRVCQANSMTRDFRQKFVQTLGGDDADIVFIGLPTGCVYYVVVSSRASVFLSRPMLMYSCPYSVFDVVSIQGAEDNLFSKIGIVLSCGTVVLVSYDIASHSLCYTISNLPSYPQVLMDTGDSFIYGDGLDLWHCTMDRSTSSIDCNLLTIKGVCFITKFVGDSKILVATVHNTFYSLLLKDSSPLQNVKETPTCFSSVNEITKSLYKELEQIEFYKKEVNCEENLISAISIFSRYMLYEKFFRAVVSVQSLSCISVENYVLNYGHSNDCEEILRGNKSLSNLFLISIVVENICGFEFSPLLWSLVSSVTLSGVTTQKCNKLLRSFSNSSSLSCSLIVCIEQPFLGVSVSISLVNQLLDDCTCSTMSPWLIIPLVVNKLDIACFLRSSMIEIKNKDVFTEKILYLAQKSNPSLNKAFMMPFEKSNVFEPCYVYDLYVPPNSNVNELWLIIQQLCGCDHLVEENKNVNTHSIGNKFSASAGAVKIEFILSGQRIKISSQSPLLLCAVKSIIIERWTHHSDSAQAIPLHSSVVARALLFKEKLKIEKLTHSKLEFETFKNAWRHFISEYLSV